MRTTPRRLAAALAITGGLLAAACTGASSDDTTSTTGVPTTVPGSPVTTDAAPTSVTTTRSRAVTTTTRAPVRGGTLVVGMPTPTVLDPILVDGDADGGGSELLAVYDSLARFDPDTATYEPRLAQSFVPNVDLTVWAVTIRAGVVFADGTPFDAAAVKFGIDRHRTGRAGAPACELVRACARGTSAVVASMAFVRDVVVTGPMTLSIVLTVPWADLPWLLATEVGMIPSPTALAAACPADVAAHPKDCAFARAPVGAGPFTVASFVPGSSLVLQRNDRYWGAAPPLDGIRFTATADQGGPRALDALVTGGLDMAYLREPRAVRDASDKRLPGRVVQQHAGSTEVLNLGGTVTCRGGAPAPTCTGVPDGPVELTPATRFLRVRLAIAAAIDPGVVAERVTGTRRDGDGDLVGRETDLWPRASDRTYDPELARRLAAEARANGWDGKVRYLCDNSALGQARGIAIETMLKAAGIDPVVDTTHDATAVREQRDVARAFDVACDGFTDTADATTGAADGSTLASLTAHLAADGPANHGGWRDERADAALLALRAARTENDRRNAVRALLDEVHKDAPVVVTGARAEALVWSARVRGVVGTAGSRVLLDRAFVVTGS